MKKIEVVAALLFLHNKLMIARRAAHKSLKGKWELAGGKIESGETHQQALERELYEEFGVRTKTREHFFTNEHSYSTFTIKLYVYFSEYISGDFILVDHDKIEFVEIQKLSAYEFAEADIAVINKLMALPE